MGSVEGEGGEGGLGGGGVGWGRVGERHEEKSLDVSGGVVEGVAQGGALQRAGVPGEVREVGQRS